MPPNISKYFKRKRKQTKKVHTQKQKTRQTTFTKRKRKYDYTFNYIVDVEYPSKIQRFFMVAGSPFWYNMILIITLIDAIAYMHAPILGPHRLITSDLKYQIMIEIIVTVFKFADIILAIGVDYILKLEYFYDTKRSMWILMCEIIGAIPFYPPVPRLIILGGHLLKFVRIFHHIYVMRVSLRCHVRLRVFYFLISLITCETIYAWIYFHLGTGEPGWHTYMVIFEAASASLMSKGGLVSSAHHYSDSIWLNEVPMAVGIILVLFIIVKPTLCDIICLMTMEYSSKFKYIYKVHFFESAIAPKYNCNSLVVQTIMNYLRNFWEERRGCIETPEMTEAVAIVFPRCLIMEMCLDCYFDMFRHSQILREMEIPVMRNLAIRIQNKLYMKGQYIYLKRTRVDYMIYVKTGAIEVLSTENGDAGVISLAAGTCIGEAALFYSYKSSVNFRCQSMCQIFMLHRKDFMFVARSYPFAFNDMLQMINTRLCLAKKIKRERDQHPNALVQQEQLVWLKATLHNYAAMLPGLRDLHLVKNIYLGSFLTNMQRNFSPLTHTLRYLDMISLKTREDDNKELVFIRSKCLWILKYNSPVMKMWDIFIAVLSIIVFIIQPYIAFNGTTPVLKVIVAAMYFLYFVDLLISLITPPSVKSCAITVEAIFGERFRTIGLYLDLCSIVQFDMFGHVFPFRNERWCFLFHILKLWKVYRLLDKWSSRFKLNLLLQKYCVFVLSQCVYVYIMGYILLMDGIIPSPLDPVGIQISTGVGFKIKSGLLKCTILYAFVNTFAAIFEALGVASVTAANYMKYVYTGRIFLCLERLQHLAKRQPHSQLFKRLNSFVNTQINNNRAFLCVFDLIRFFNFPEYCLELMKSHIYQTALMDMEFLQFVPKEVIKKLSISATTQLYHKHSLILSFGTKYNDIFIIVRGDARTVYGDKYYNTNKYCPINLLEVIFHTPCASNVVAITEVEIVTFSYDKLKELLSQYKSPSRALQASIDELRGPVTTFLKQIINGKQVVIKTLDKQVPDSFVKFSLKNVFEDSYEEYDYFAPFDRSSWSFVKFLLMRVTIPPHGKFFFWWEVLRLIFAYTSCLLFFIPPISLQPLRHPCTYVLIFLDIMALIDVFLRLHVCYYDDKGLLITHPLYTARNYLRKAFVIDFLAAFPFYLLVLDSPQYRMIFNILHILQLYRLFGFKMHFFYTKFTFDCVYILLTIICPVNFLACAIFMVDCYDWENEDNSEIACQNFKETTPLANFITILYFLMSTFTCSGTGSVVDLENVTPMILHITSFCSFASTFLRIYVTAYLFGSYNKIYSGRHKMRDKIRRLMTFLRKESVTPYLRKQLRIYYELKWRWLQRINPYNQSHNLTPSLRRDLHYVLFGEHIHEYCSLEDAPYTLKNFFKNVIFEATPTIVPKNGYILTLNDIHSSVYLLYKGSIDVVAANGTVIETLLDGAIFGNMEPTEYYRQRVSFVTNTVCRVMSIDANKFYQFLDMYPFIKKSYHGLKNRYFYYIPSAYEENPYEKEQFSWSEKQLKIGYTKYRSYFILSWFHFIFPCCIGLAMELYQIATGEVNYIYLAIQYSFDAIHLVHQYLKFYTPYMNQQQEFVLNPIRIKAHSMRKKRLYFKLYFINLPFDLPFVIVLWFLNRKLVDWSLLFSLFRLNRLVRFLNIAQVYYNGFNKVASFSRSFKLFILFLLLVYSAQLIGTIIAVADYTYTHYYQVHESQIISEMPVESLIYSRVGPSYGRLELYGRYCYFSLLVHTFSHDNIYYPKGTLFDFLFIFIFLYVTVFESYVMVQYYQILMETTTLVKIVYTIRQYVEVQYDIPNSAYVVREKVNEAIHHYYGVKSVADDYLMRIDAPRYLHDAVHLHIYGYLFQRHPYFGGCHADFLRQVVSHMRCVYYPINATLVNRSDCHDTMYFVHKGEVAALRYENDVMVNAEFVFSKGDSFGYQQALQNLPFQYTYKAVTFCEIMELSWNDCKYLVNFFPVTADIIQKATAANVKHFIRPTGTVAKQKKLRI